MKPSHRSIGLDVIRAVAVLMVLVCHSVPCPPGVSAWGHALSLRINQGGLTGVDLFFVLSGFLIGGLLFKEQKETGRIQLGRFLLRRGFKIYPPFWIFLGFIVVWEHSRGLSVGLDDLLPELLFYQNYRFGVWGTTWTLAVEEHFYLLLSISLLALAFFNRPAQRPFRHLPWLFAAVAVICFSFRAWNTQTPFENYTHMTPTHLRIDALFFGTLLAWVRAYEHARFEAFCLRFRWQLLAGGVTGFLPAFFLPLYKSWEMQTFGIAVQWLASGALICFAIVQTSVPGRIARGFAAIGRASYATYLWHFWVGRHGLVDLAALCGFKWNWFTFTPCYYLATLCAGALLTVLFEKPFLLLRDWLMPASRRQQARAELSQPLLARALPAN